MRAGAAGLFVPSGSILNRTGPGVKMCGLAACGALFVLWTGPWSAAGALLIALTAVFLARLSPVRVLNQLRPLAVLLIAMVAYHALMSTLARGFEIGADLLALVVLASVFTATTRSDDLIQVLVRAASRLNRVPLLGRWVQPEVLAFSISLMLHTVPTLATVWSEVRDAARARGLGRTPRALVVPLAVRTVSQAVTSGQALAARGLLDGGEPELSQEEPAQV